MAGGFRDPPPPPPTCFPENMPKIGEELTERLLTVEAYCEAAFANGIPFLHERAVPHGRFPLTELSKDPGLRARFKRTWSVLTRTVNQNTYARIRLPTATAAPRTAWTCVASIAPTRGPSSPPSGSVTARRLPTTCTRPHTCLIETVLDETHSRGGQVCKSARRPQPHRELCVHPKRPLELFKTYRVDVEITDASEFKTFTKATHM